FCKVKLKQINHEIADAFVRRIQRIPEVTECYNTSGAYDLTCTCGIILGPRRTGIFCGRKG
ncbi:MAG: Lrp/AsnC ligand binding domain-containing protein, partial [Lachnospiraceae bacterium]|nr:Lrp/AsnC ligand binding domain-containing protein [Lachnospiraceae bacterium]